MRHAATNPLLSALALTFSFISVSEILRFFLRIAREDTWLFNNLAFLILLPAAIAALLLLIRYRREIAHDPFATVAGILTLGAVLYLAGLPLFLFPRQEWVDRPMLTPWKIYLGTIALLVLVETKAFPIISRAYDCIRAALPGHRPPTQTEPVILPRKFPAPSTEQLAHISTLARRGIPEHPAAAMHGKPLPPEMINGCFKAYMNGMPRSPESVKKFTAHLVRQGLVKRHDEIYAECDALLSLALDQVHDVPGGVRWTPDFVTNLRHALAKKHPWMNDASFRNLTSFVQWVCWHDGLNAPKR